MKLHRALIVAAALIAAAALLGLWGYGRLPAGTVMGYNYGLDGRPHAFMGKAVGLGLMPLIGAGVILLLALLPRIAPVKKGLDVSAGPYGLMITGLAAVFLVSEGALIAHALDPSFDVLRWVFLAVAALLVLLGNFLGKVRHNYLFGIRTPWTLTDARVWDKTHRFTGRLLLAGGVLLAAGCLAALDHIALIVLVVVCAAGPMIAGGVYSWTIRAGRA
jgi:uncharacterized membrane protein